MNYLCGSQLIHYSRPCFDTFSACEQAHFSSTCIHIPGFKIHGRCKTLLETFIHRSHVNELQLVQILKKQKYEQNEVNILESITE